MKPMLRTRTTNVPVDTHIDTPFLNSPPAGWRLSERNRRTSMRKMDSPVFPEEHSFDLDHAISARGISVPVYA